MYRYDGTSMATDDIGQARPARSWRLRNPRGSSGSPLTADERRVHPDADIYALVAAVVATALEDLNIGYTGPGAGTSNERYWRGSAYVWFLAGAPTGFERFAARLGVPARGRLPAHPLLDDAAALAGRRADVAALGLPPGLLDGRIVMLMTSVLRRCNYEFRYPPLFPSSPNTTTNRGTASR